MIKPLFKLTHNITGKVIYYTNRELFSIVISLDEYEISRFRSIWTVTRLTKVTAAEEILYGAKVEDE